MGKGLLSLTKIRSYIKNRCILGKQAKDIFNEICRVYGNNKLSFSSVTRWCKKFKSSVDSVEDAPHTHCPKTATSQKIVEKVTNLVAINARFTTRHIAKCLDISVEAAQTLLRRDLKMRSFLPEQELFFCKEMGYPSGTSLEENIKHAKISAWLFINA